MMFFSEENVEHEKALPAQLGASFASDDRHMFLFWTEFAWTLSQDPSRDTKCGGSSQFIVIMMNFLGMGG